MAPGGTLTWLCGVSMLNCSCEHHISKHAVTWFHLALVPPDPAPRGKHRGSEKARCEVEAAWRPARTPPPAGRPQQAAEHAWADAPLRVSVAPPPFPLTRLGGWGPCMPKGPSSGGGGQAGAGAPAQGLACQSCVRRPDGCKGCGPHAHTPGRHRGRGAGAHFPHALPHFPYFPHFPHALLSRPRRLRGQIARAALSPLLPCFCNQRLVTAAARPAPASAAVQ